MVRDLLIGEVPCVLRSELYAVAALAGALVIVVGHLLGLQPLLMAIAGASICFGLRYLAIRRGWRLPISRWQIISQNEDGGQTDAADAKDDG